MTEMESLMTPKDKQILDQKIRSKKKQFLRFLQSDPNCLPYCCSIVNDEFRKSLEIEMKKLIDENTKQEEEAVKLDDSETATTTKKRSQKSNRNKAIKFSEIIFGLNETFKMIERKQIKMIWLEEKSLALNLQNIIKKLCSDNHIICLNFELKNFKTFFNLSSLAIMAFKQTITMAESKFNEIYSIVTNHLNDSTEKPLPSPSSSKSVDESIDDQQTIESSESKNLNFYLENSNDRYSEMMKKRLDSQPLTDSENGKFLPQESFIAFTKDTDDDEYFLDYKSSANEQPKIEIIWPDQSHYEQRKQLTKKFAEKLYELDEFGEHQFKKPRQIKGQLDGSIMAVEKRKQKSDKRKKRKEFIQKKKKQK
ncbi:uncharacterized protein LOC142645881 [Dermatophagoides pteronyssinus]|uniref:uncharacterized protein LOC142645881 n=1 Tax=Dermatophagoides pteronyssinus TaxID=6956 RepID=UPI003F667ABD